MHSQCGDCVCEDKSSATRSTARAARIGLLAGSRNQRPSGAPFRGADGGHVLREKQAASVNQRGEWSGHAVFTAVPGAQIRDGPLAHAGDVAEGAGAEA